MKITTSKLKKLIKDELFYREFHKGKTINEAPTNDDLMVDISNMIMELEEMYDVMSLGNVETHDMGGPDPMHVEDAMDFVGQAMVELKRALSSLKPV